ncbi:DNA damage-induced apoptosis suppressor protein [Trichosurus vulpecula]|uniref:DNA damage-induced apoptosis suppressor protein n=1 Tax=Trichosurus vulpecula TaxID=9337 RepID=UPI00186B08BB|nr:DNA damage-induced apoptosis suppressor protein [Trichosurus vulpecula]
MNRRKKFLIASIVAVQNSSFIYPSCQKCFSRVILVSKRFDCSRCGYTGEAKNVTYRYKLSLKVSDANRLFAITVFGSCLDAFFGITATCLNRYIKDSNQIEGTLDSNSIQDLLTQAVQVCFVGRTFIFGVTNFENEGERASASNNFLQKCPHNDRHIKELVACQISLPNSNITGYTVINYFDQLLQSSNFKNIHCGPQLSDSHLLEGDHPSSELSSLGSSGSSSCFVQSSGRDRLSRLWQQFLGLTPVVTQPADDEDFSISEQSKDDGVILQQRERASSAEVTHVNNYHEPIQDCHSPHLSLGEESKRGKLDTESGLPASHLTATLNNYHEIGAANNWSSFCPLEVKQSPEESNTDLFPSTLETEEKCSQPKLTHHQGHKSDLSSSFQKRPPFNTSSPSPEANAGNTQEGDPEIWDDLPFSESLNAFIAVIENENTIVQATKCHKGKDITPVDDHCDRSLANPQKATGSMHVPHVRSEVKHKNCDKSSVFSSCGPKMISTSQKEIQQDNTASCFSISINGKEISDCAIPNANVSVLSQAPKDFRTYLSFKKSDSFPQYKVEIIPSPNTSGNVHSCTSTKYSVKHGERQSLKMDGTVTSLCSEKHVFSDACARNKGHSIWLQNQEGSLTTCWGLVQNPKAHCSNKNVSTNVFALMPEPQGITSTIVKENLLQNYSPTSESSYNASADLFDVSAKQMEAVAEYIDKSQGILSTWETVLTANHPESNFPLSPVDDNCSHFQRRSSLQNILTHPGTHSSPYFQSDSDYDLGDSQEFVPYSQSTPIVPLHHRLRVHRMKESYQKYPRLYTNLHSNYKNSAMTFEDGIQQPTQKGLKNENTVSLRSRNISIADDSQPMLINSSPTIKFFETNFDDWVLPTTKKAFPSPVLPTSDMLGLGFRVPGKWPAACSTPTQAKGPKNKKRQIEHRTAKDLIGKEFHLENKDRVTAMKQITPELKNCKDSRGCSSKNAALRNDSLSNVKCRLSFSENESLPAAEVANDWSPELFTQSQPNPISKHLKIPVWKL